MATHLGRINVCDMRAPELRGISFNGGTGYTIYWYIMPVEAGIFPGRCRLFVDTGYGVSIHVPGHLCIGDF